MRAISVSLLLGLVYLISELLLTVTRRSRSRTGTKQDRSTLRVVDGAQRPGGQALPWLRIFRRRHACRYSYSAHTS